VDAIERAEVDASTRLWGPEEIALGKAAYKLGGAHAVVFALPHRGLRACYHQAKRLGWYWDGKSRISKRELRERLGLDNEYELPRTIDPNAPKIDTHGLLHRFALGLKPRPGGIEVNYYGRPIVRCLHCNAIGALAGAPRGGRIFLIPVEGIDGKFECRNEAGCERRIMALQKTA
jgi:hypothetical protein